MWYGEFIHTLDEKDRFILPAKFREKVKALDNRIFYLTRGFEHCLALYSYEEWQKLVEKLKTLSFTKRESRLFNRQFFSGAQELIFDAQGRAIIPEYLKEYARIKRDIVIVGVAERIEIWARLEWKKFFEENKDRFEEVAENLFE
ncbi:MAG: division/cell wall cluster transcriptional repressor MraZ [Candidatus Omnitrophota bacterium]|nr:MAG: division/cell wall cluster transcriptional repressor MraZ [Candidatus Omnitrophota bacterium]